MPPPLHRAYSLLAIKSVDDEQRIITGLATTPTPDRYGDIVEPKGAEFQLPIPLLWQHRSVDPIGEVFEAKVTPSGIEIKARVQRITEPGTLKDRLDEAWQSLKYQLVRGLSIGFTSIEYSRLENGGLRFLKWAWLELSCVTIPANQEATIQAVKSAASAALGTEVPNPDRSPTPGASGTAKAAGKAGTKGTHMKTISEQIKDFETSLAAKSAEMTALLQKSGEAGTTMDAADGEKYDGLKAEAVSIKTHLDRLREHEEINKAAAAPVETATKPPVATPSVRVVEPELPKGILFARYVGCKAASAVQLRSGNFVSPLDLAKQRYPSSTLLKQVFERGVIPAGTTSGSHWADDLVPYKVLADDFIEFLRGKTIVDRFGQDGIPSLRRVPFNVRAGGFSAGTTGYWKGEGKPVPVSKATSTSVTLTWSTVAGLTVITKELATHSTPSAETALRDDLAAAVIARMDLDFVDPAKAAVANTSPASITFGLAANPPSGTGAVHVRKDLATLFAAFATAKLGRSNLVLIMSDTMLGNIAMMTNALGNKDFGIDLSAKVPRIEGIPVIASEHLTSVGSPSTQMIVMVKADEVYLADDGMVDVEASFEASIEMLDDTLLQDGTTGTGAALVNLWQNGLIGLLANREINWKLRRAEAVEYISPAAYAPPSS